ncbi:MAG: YceD family protein [Rhodococcus sp. (in: high G+C Gram-positive bacteria)]
MPPPKRTTRPELDGGFVLDILNLGRRPGSTKTVERTVPAPSRIGLDAIAIEAGVPVSLDLQLQAVSEGVLVTGSVRAATAGECTRCLDPVSGNVDVYLTELFAYPNSITEETTDADEIHRIVDDLIDLEPVIVDAVGLELPLHPVCSDECEGLCPECGVRLAIAESGHSHDTIDPRWAGLAAKFGVDPEPSTELVNNEAEEK